MQTKKKSPCTIEEYILLFKILCFEVLGVKIWENMFNEKALRTVLTVR